MDDRYETAIRSLLRAVLDGPGVTATGTRKAIEASSATAAGRSGSPAAEVPAVLEPYLEKMARHAYKVTDQDIQALEEAGYSEDAIFEITVSAALGAGMGRLERGLAALQGGK